MTFLEIAHARDCILALSDRRESVDQSDPNEVTKYCLCVAEGYYIALSGDGKTASGLLNELRISQPSRADIFKEIDRLAAKLYLSHHEGNVAGHLIVSDGGKFKTYAIYIVSGILAYCQIADPVRADGDAGAVAPCKRLARDIPMSDMPCEAAARRLHTMASYIAETVKSVGDRDEFGFDMVVFSKSGTVMELRRRTDAMGSICARFEASGAGPLFGPDGGT